ncbi:unnamed protein product [Effrenium voratum]|nr:unnamed protein product [Effrenium voratum]
MLMNLAGEQSDINRWHRSLGFPKDTEIHEYLYAPLPKNCQAVCLFDCCHSATVANLCETMVVQEGPLTEAKKQKLLAELTKQKDAIGTKVRFFTEVNTGKLDIKKKSKEELNQLLAKSGFPKSVGDYNDDGSGYTSLAQLDEKSKAVAKIQNLKPGEGAKIYIGNLEEDEQEDYKKSHQSKMSKEVRVRYLPQPEMDIEEEESQRQFSPTTFRQERSVKPLGAGMRDVVRKEKFTDHERRDDIFFVGRCAAVTHPREYPRRRRPDSVYHLSANFGLNTPDLLYGLNAQNLTFGVNAPNVHTGMNAQNLPFGANSQNVPFSLNTPCPNVNPLPTTNVNSGTQMNAATFASALGSGLSEHPQRVVHSAMDLLGKPSLPGGHAAHPQGRLSGDALIAQALSRALSGEKRPIPCWNGATTTLRSWLKLLALWEHESQIPQDKRGIKLLQSFPEGSQPRRIADTVPTDILISAKGYSAILSKLLEKYGPFLEATGPQAVDKFLFEGERGRGESFSSFVATKELARQEMESHLGEHVSDRLCGRILLRQANLNELQRELVSLKGPMMRTFDEVANMLRPLDRPEALARPDHAAYDLGDDKAYFEEDEDEDAEEESLMDDELQWWRNERGYTKRDNYNRPFGGKRTFQKGKWNKGSKSKFNQKGKSDDGGFKGSMGNLQNRAGHDLYRRSHFPCSSGYTIKLDNSWSAMASLKDRINKMVHAKDPTIPKEYLRQCGSRWERHQLEETTVGSNSSSHMVVEKPLKGSYPEYLPPPRYRPDMNKLVKVTTKEDDKIPKSKESILATEIKNKTTAMLQDQFNRDTENANAGRSLRLQV